MVRSSWEVVHPQRSVEAFEGTDEQWFAEDVARLDARNPDWNRASRVQDACRWLRKGKEVHIVQGIFGQQITEEALHLEKNWAADSVG